MNAAATFAGPVRFESQVEIVRSFLPTRRRGGDLDVGGRAAGATGKAQRAVADLGAGLAQNAVVAVAARVGDGGATGAWSKV